MNAFDDVRRRLRGPIVPLKIPYHEDERIDHDELARYVDWLCDNGAPVLLLTYGSAEYMCLSDDEIYAVTRTIGEAARGRSLFIAGDNFWPLAKTIDYIQHATSCGAHAVKAHLHWKFKYDADGVVAYYRRLGEAAPDTPLLAYTDFQPGMPIDVARRLANEVPQCVGMKNDTDQFVGQHQYMRHTPPDFEVLSGGTMRSMLMCHPYGGRAYLCPIAPFAPERAGAFFAAVEAGRYDEAAWYVNELESPLMELTPRYGAHWQVFIRAVMHAAGRLRSAQTRLPFTPLTDAQLESLRADLDQLGVPRAVPAR